MVERALETELSSKVPPHTSPSHGQLVLLATPFTPVVVEAPKPLEDVMTMEGPATRVPKSTVPPSPSTPLEEAFTSKPHRSPASPGGTDFAHAPPARRGSCSHWRDVTISSVTELRYV